MYSCANGIHGLHDCLLSWLDVGGHINVSMDTINTTMHDCLLSWLDVGGHISVSKWTQIYKESKQSCIVVLMVSMDTLI
jgi:hypothetical protein